jgi:hypothetical protein
MENKKTYSVTDLVNELKLPRSTVNDWLIRYEQYIEFAKRGKRKVFFASTLKVLQEISKLRSQDKSSFEIEQELAHRHPVQAEVASAPEQAASTNKETADSKQNNSPDSMLPTLNKQNEELTALFGTRFEEISKYLASAEQQSKQVSGKIRRWYLTAMVLLALLTAAFAFAVIKISKVLDEQKSQLSNNRGIIQQQNNNVIAELKDNQQRLKETQQTIATQAADLNKMGLRLDRNSADYTKNIAELKNGLKEQRERFATMLEHARKNAAKEQAAELARQRDAFAKQQLAKLHRFETMAANLKKQQEEIAILKLRLSAKQASLDEVMRRANEIKKTVVSPGKKKPVKLVKKRVVAPAKKVIQKATIKPAENLNKSQDKQ